MSQNEVALAELGDVVNTAVAALKQSKLSYQVLLLLLLLL